MRRSIALALTLALAPAVSHGQGTPYFRVSPGVPASSPGPADASPPPAGQASALSLRFSASPQANVGDAAGGGFVPSGGIPPYTVTATSGFLPTGTTVGPSGALQGSYQAAGVFSGTAGVTDGAGGQASAPFSVTVRPAAPVISLPTPTGLVAGVPFSSTAVNLSGGTLTWSLSRQPSWLSVGATSGVVGGLPPQPGPLTFDIAGTDAFGRSDSSAAGPFPVSAATASMASVPSRIRSGTPLSVPLTTNVNPGAWSVASNPNAGWLSLSGDTLSGTVPAVSQDTPYTVTATRASTVPGAVAAPSDSTSLTVVGPLSAAAPPDYAVASGSDVGPSALAPQATNVLSASQLTWALASSSGPLPPGITVDAATGKLKGTLVSYPSTTTFPGIALTATDSDATTATTPAGFTLTVNAALPTMTFSTTLKSSQVALSNNNLTASVTSNINSHNRVLANVSIGASDKRYYEVYIDNIGASGNVFVGYALPGNYTTYLGNSSSNSIGLAMTNGRVYGQAGSRPNLSPISAGSTVMVAIDPAKQQVWYGVNGTWSGTPGSTSGSFSWSASPAGSSPAVSVFGTGKATIRLENMTYSPPAGFSPY